MKEAIIITGALGGIGQALCQEFSQSGYFVIGIDRAGERKNVDCCLIQDIQSIVSEEPESTVISSEIKKCLTENNLLLKGIINNAAIQILGGVESLSSAHWMESLNTNLLAPFFLSQVFLKDLEKSQGAIVNISSIHEKLTKKEFVAYATTKAALSGLTRTMAVDLGNKVRVNAICPAAIETPMLKAGFEGMPEAYEALNDAHPTGCIGHPSEVAKLAKYLVSEAPLFLTGTCIGLDGAISGRLHDPA